MVWVRKDFERASLSQETSPLQEEMSSGNSDRVSFTPIETGLENSGVQSLEGIAAILVGIVSFLLWKFENKI